MRRRGCNRVPRPHVAPVGLSRGHRRGTNPHHRVSRGPFCHREWEPRLRRLRSLELQPHPARGWSRSERRAHAGVRGRRAHPRDGRADGPIVSGLRRPRHPAAARVHERIRIGPRCERVDFGDGHPGTRDRHTANRNPVRRNHVSDAGPRAGPRRHRLLPDHRLRPGGPGPTRARAESRAHRGVPGRGPLQFGHIFPADPLRRSAGRGPHRHPSVGGRRGHAADAGRIGFGHVPHPVRPDRGHQSLPVGDPDHPGRGHLGRLVLSGLGALRTRPPRRPSPREERMRTLQHASERGSDSRRRSYVLVLSVIGVLAASFSASTAKAVAPALSILSPTDGTIVPGGNPVMVRFAISNFTMVQPGRAGQVGNPNEGHARAYLDGQGVRLVTDPEPFSLSLPSGPHTIRMQLFADNGTPLSPDVSASVRVIATQGPAAGVPEIKILSPTPLEATGHGIYVSYRISNFTLVEPPGQPNAPNEGHLQLLVEGIVVMEVVQYDPVLLVSLPDGDLTIGARLVNNDGSEVTPSAAASVAIHVAASSAVSLPLVSNGGIALLLAFILVVLVLRRRKAARGNEKLHVEEP